jgi:hypothetical protein
MLIADVPIFYYEAVIESERMLFSLFNSKGNTALSKADPFTVILVYRIGNPVQFYS